MWLGWNGLCGRRMWSGNSGSFSGKRVCARDQRLLLVGLLDGFFDAVEEAADGVAGAFEGLAGLGGGFAEVLFQVLGFDADVGEFDLAHDGEQDETGDVGGVGDVVVGGVDVEGDVALGHFGAAVVLDGDGADVDAKFIDSVLAGAAARGDDAFEFHGVGVALVGFDDDELFDVDEHVVDVGRAAEHGAEAVVDVKLGHVDEHFFLILGRVHELQVADVHFAGEEAEVDGTDLERKP